MSSDTLFPEESNEVKVKPKREKTLQQKLMDYLRTGKPINEEIYNSEIGGYSLSSTVRNCEDRGLVQEGEFIYPYWERDKEGNKVRTYKMIYVVQEKEETPIPDAEKVINVVWGGDECLPETPPEIIKTVEEFVQPELRVESIYVGVSKGLPEIMIVLEGVDKPIRKVIMPRDAAYLIAALSPFVKE
jgi:hypothetical protein